MMLLVVGLKTAQEANYKVRQEQIRVDIPERPLATMNGQRIFMSKKFLLMKT